MSAIEFRNVTKRFPGAGYNAVDGVSFAVEKGEFVTILGSSGCGKTTMLKMVNRLYDPDEGEVFLFEKNIKDTDSVQLRRSIGYVIQQVGLFPHMTIGENVAAVPKLLKWDEERISAKVNELLSMIGLSPDEFRDRYPAQLSGGQQQRVGLARALAIDPKLMLMDEPFGAIDSITRLSLQDELLKLQRSMNRTILFVTHDVEEAFKLGTRVLIMNNGRICQFDKPEEILRNPADTFVNSLVDSAKAKEAFWQRYM